jgi:tRNA-2-methylthio-N6-dimethylallyladenosine synthase
MLNTAAYSPRPNTESATWAEQVEETVKQDRLQRINKLANEHAYERSQRFLNRVEEVLVEDINVKNIRQVYGRTGHGRLCYFDGDYEILKGQFVHVNITDARMYTLYGHVIK